MRARRSAATASPASPRRRGSSASASTTRPAAPATRALSASSGGVPLPSRFVRIRINDTPGVRGNTRLIRKLWRLADDPEVDGVVLQLRADPAGSLAHAEEVADAIRGLRARKKKVLCHLEDAGSRA